MKSILKSAASRWPFPVKAELKCGRQMYVDLRSSVSRGIYVKGEFDPAVFDAIRAGLELDSVFVDVGANVGVYSIQALDIVGESGSVHAFEIDPRPLRCLEKSKKKFNYGNLFIHRVAVGASEGTVSLSPDLDCGNSHVSQAATGLAVPMTYLDRWMQAKEIERIDVVKIDVEGFEFEVLQGARELVDRFRPRMVIEADDQMLARNNASVALIRNFLSPWGYQFSHVQDCWSPTLLATVNDGS